MTKKMLQKKLIECNSELQNIAQTLQYVRDWLCDKFRIISIVSLPQTTFSHVKAGVKSSILFLKKYDKKINGGIVMKII